MGKDMLLAQMELIILNNMAGLTLEQLTQMGAKPVNTQSFQQLQNQGAKPAPPYNPNQISPQMIQAKQKQGFGGIIGKIAQGAGQGLQQAAQAGIGALKSIPATLNNASQLGQSALRKITSKVPGMGNVKNETPSVVKAISTPTNQDQAAGFLGGQLAQGAAIPNSAIDAGAGEIANLANAGKAQPLITGLAKAAAQTGTGMAAAKLGGATNKQAATTGLLSGALSGAGSLFSEALKSSAETSMSKALGATTKSNKALSAKVVPELVENKTMALTRGSLYNKAAANVDKADEQLTNAYNFLPPDTKSNWTGVLTKLQVQKDALTVNGTVLDDGKYNALHRVQSDLLKVIGGGVDEATDGNVSIQSARKARQILDAAIKEKNGVFGITGTESDKLNATKSAANAIRAQLALEHPNIAAINKEFSFWKNVQDVVGSTIQRTKNQTSLSGEMAQDTGAAIGAMHGGTIGSIGSGAVVGKLLKSTLQSTAWRTASAAVKSSIADALANGNAAKVTTLLQKLTNPTKAK